MLDVEPPLRGTGRRLTGGSIRSSTTSKTSRQSRVLQVSALSHTDADWQSSLVVGATP